MKFEKKNSVYALADMLMFILSLMLFVVAVRALKFNTLWWCVLIAAIIINPFLLKWLDKKLHKGDADRINRYKMLFFCFCLVIVAAVLGGKNEGESGKEKNGAQETIATDTFEAAENINDKDSSSETQNDILEADGNVEIKELLGADGYNNFAEACGEINLDVNQISGFSQIDDWASGNRYSFTYKNTEFLLYMLQSNYVSGINVGSVHVYEDGKEPLNADDYLLDEATISSLEGMSEALVKQQLNYPDTANFDWWTTGSITRIQDYWILMANLTAKNALGQKETIEFRTDYKVNNGEGELAYFTMDGTTISGSENVPQINRGQAESKIKGSSDNAIILTESQMNEYGVEEDGIILYYLPAGKYTTKCLNKGMAFVCDPADDENAISYTFDSVGETKTIEIPEGWYIQLMINTSLEMNKM